MLLLNILCAVGLFCLIKVSLIQQGICLTTEKLPTCLNTSTVKGCGLIVEHGQPSTYKGRNASVLINASLVGHQPESIDYRTCTWTFNMDGLVVVQPCTKQHWNESSLQFVFKTPGLTKVTVIAEFFTEDNQEGLISNCTFVNVTDCSRQLALEVSSAKGYFNVSQNQTEVTLNSPGYVNFTILVFNIIDPFYICQSFFYNWSLGDGQHLRNKEHVSHFYNHSGLFHVVLDIFNGGMFYKNISLTVDCVKDCSRQLALEVSSAKGSFNVSQNQTEVTLNSPGYVNFTILVFNISDPFYLCQSFFYNWSLGDGQHLRNKEHVSHFYNHSGLFHVVLDIFNGGMFYKNISLTVCVKENPSPDTSTDAAVDVSLVLAICLAVFFVIVCLLLIFRKRRHRLTEVARFDFRHEDFQSSNDNIHYKYKQGCFQALICRRGSDERSVLVINEYNSSYRSFGTSTLPTEEL